VIHAHSVILIALAALEADISFCVVGCGRLMPIAFANSKVRKNHDATNRSLSRN
jgi:hypothetical protein